MRFLGWSYFWYSTGLRRSGMKIISVVGARPNFMKIAPFIRALKARTSGKEDITHLLVHTGQHYDDNMSRVFFQALDISMPDIDLGIGSGTHAEQVGKTMIEFEKVVRARKPDWIVVVGDVNATCACSIVAKKENVKLAHIEAGLRSFDLRMPEEINRMVTDRLSDLLFTTSSYANENLGNEGVCPENIKFVGNIMIDTLEAHRSNAEKIDLRSVLNTAENTGHNFLQEGLEDGKGFAVLTMHRPSNVDQKETLGSLVRFFIDVVAAEMPLVWTLHPRTRNRLEEFGLLPEVERCRGIILLKPVGYLEMLKLNMEAGIVFTDSGGLQEECCIFGTPCVTLRENTERPETLVENGGLSMLAGNKIDKIHDAFSELKDSANRVFRPPLWDGRTAERIVEEMLKRG